MNDEMNLSLPPAAPSTPRRDDLDDLIFQGEGWLASDR